MPFRAGDSLSVVPDEGWAPKKKLRGVVTEVSNDKLGRPAYFVTSEEGDQFWLTARGAVEASGMVFHAESSAAKVPDPESGHGFVFVGREEAIQPSETTRGK
jgi:hypothetical protein